MSKKEDLITKKTNLISSLAELDMLDKLELKAHTRFIKNLNLANESDFNANLTQFIYNLIDAHPTILTSPTSKSLKQFCQKQIGLIEDHLEYEANIGYKSAPKRR